MDCEFNRLEQWKIPLVFVCLRGEVRQGAGVHLSRDEDPLNTEARAGIERRNRLLQIKTQLRVAQAALEQAAAISQEGDEF